MDYMPEETYHWCLFNSTNENMLSGYALFSVMCGCRERPKNGCQVREIVLSPSVDFIMAHFFTCLWLVALRENGRENSSLFSQFPLP